METADHWINQLNLLPHPEGGYYRETYRSAERIPSGGIHSRFTGDRNVSTSIYFLLRNTDRSLFHRIKSDELWHFHAGDTLHIYVLESGGLKVYKLGSDISSGESLQVVVPANHWFGAMVIGPGQFVLSGCTVAPGFDFQDFEMADRSALLKEFPGEMEIILALTK